MSARPSGVGWGLTLLLVAACAADRREVQSEPDLRDAGHPVDAGRDAGPPERPEPDATLGLDAQGPGDAGWALPDAQRRPDANEAELGRADGATVPAEPRCVFTRPTEGETIEREPTFVAGTIQPFAPGTGVELWAQSRAPGAIVGVGGFRWAAYVRPTADGAFREDFDAAELPVGPVDLWATWSDGRDWLDCELHFALR